MKHLSLNPGNGAVGMVDGRFEDNLLCYTSQVDEFLVGGFIID